MPASENITLQDEIHSRGQYEMDGRNEIILTGVKEYRANRKIQKGGSRT